MGKFSNFLLNAGTGLKNAGSAMIKGFENGIHSSAASFDSGSKKIAGALGVSAKTGSVILAGLLAAAIGTTASLPFMALREDDDWADDDLVDACVEMMNSARSGSNITDAVDGNMEMLENAKKIYSFFKSRGENDAQIAGILGNWETESGIDPTKFETYYEDDYTWTDKKEEMQKNISSYTTGTVFAHYAAAGLSINRDAYRAEDGKYYCGVGIFAVTGPACKKMWDKAAEMNANWYDFDWQLAYAFAGYRPGVFDKEDWQKISTPEAAAEWVLGNYEGCPGHSSVTLRQQRARKWYEQMKSWSADESYYQTVIGMADKIGTASTTKAVKEVANQCLAQVDPGTYDNSSIAAAAVSMAWDTEAQAYNDGTELYRKVYDAVWDDGVKNPGIYTWGSKSCDIFVATSVRWAGVDDNFPSRGPASQGAYMHTSSKWEKVGSSAELSSKDPASFLQPGDVFTSGNNSGSGHIFVYTGNEIVTELKPNLGFTADSAHASWDPVPSQQRSGFMMGVPIQQFLAFDGRVYDIYRNIEPESSSVYSSIMADSRPVTSGSSSNASSTTSSKKLATKIKRLSSFQPNLSKETYWQPEGTGAGKNPYPVGTESWFVWGCFYQAYGYAPTFGWTPSRKYDERTMAYQIAEKLASNDANFTLSDTPKVGAVGSLGSADSAVSHVIFVTAVNEDGTFDYWQGDLNNASESSVSQVASLQDYHKVSGASVDDLKESVGKGTIKFANPNS